MYNEKIAYTDFAGEKRCETFHFNLTDTEVTMLQLSENGGLSSLYQTLLDAQDYAKLAKAFEQIILLAYGELSNDNKHFRKGEDISKDFKATGAYDVLFQKLMHDPEAANKFFIGIMPPKVQEEYKKNKGNMVALAAAEAAKAKEADN